MELPGGFGKLISRFAIRPVFAGCTILSCAYAPATADTTNATQKGLTQQGALTAERQITSALRQNDVPALENLLAPDWIVISADGERAGRDDVIAAIKAGMFRRTELAISNPRVRIYGNVAVVTSHASTSGLLMKKPFTNVQECQTDVLYWSAGKWASELLHETRAVHGSNC